MLDVGEISERYNLSAPNSGPNEVITYSLRGLEADTQYRLYVWAATKIGTGQPYIVDAKTAEKGSMFFSLHENFYEILWTTSPQTNFTSPLYSLWGNIY